MIGIVITTQFKRNETLKRLLDVILLSNNYRCILLSSEKCTMDSHLIKSFNIHFKKITKNNVSYAKNLGIDYFKSLKNIDWIWFLDDDCYVANYVFENLYSILNKIDTNICLVNIFDNQYKPIGGNLTVFNYLPIIKFLSLYRAGGPSIIINLNKIKKYYDINFGPGSIYRNAEDTKFLIDNFSFRINILPKRINIIHPREKYSKFKHLRYSYGHGILLKKMNFFHKINFILMVISRPFFAMILKFFFKNKFETFDFYISRLSAIKRGFFSE